MKMLADHPRRPGRERVDAASVARRTPWLSSFLLPLWVVARAGTRGAAQAKERAASFLRAVAALPGWAGRLGGANIWLKMHRLDRLERGDDEP